MEIVKPHRPEEEKAKDTADTPIRKDASFNNPIEERSFSRDEYLSIIEGAGFLKNAEEQANRRGSLLTRLGEDEAKVSLSRICHLAQDFGIDERYVQEYVAKRFPSDQQKLEDFKRLGGNPSFESLTRSYLCQLVDAVSREFPNEEFRFEESKKVLFKNNGDEFEGEYYINKKKAYYHHFLYSIKKISKKKWFFKK